MKKKLVPFSILALLIMLVACFATNSIGRAATPTITLAPSSQASGASVTVAGTGFGAIKAVGIGFGAEIPVTSEVISQTGSGYGPYTGTVANRPIKPGTAKFTIDVAGGLAIFDVTDIGNGTLTSSSQYFANGTINYVTGQYIRYATTDPGIYTIVVTAAYTHYQYGVTPAADVTTSTSGSFTTNITVPAVSVGNYAVTAIDASGNQATSTLNVGTSATPTPAPTTTPTSTPSPTAGPTATPTPLPSSSMTLTPITQAPGASVTVSGAGFGATTTVGIGFGSEIDITQEPTKLVITSYTTVASNWTYRPIKPGSFHMHFKAISGPYKGVEYDVTDDGAGKLYASGVLSGFFGILDYSLGGFLRNTTFIGTTPDDFQVTANYTSYQYNMTFFGQVITTGLGTFSANFTVPAVANGNYNVTAIDANGNHASSALTVGTSATPTPAPTTTPIPTPSPTAGPTPTPTPLPTVASTAAPTLAPTPTPTLSPSPSPSPSPTVPEFSSQLLVITLVVSMVIAISTVIIAKNSRTGKIQAGQISNLA